MRNAIPAILAMSLLATTAPAVAQERAALDVELSYERFTLSNGLDVIVHEDDSSPIVAVDVWYHVGSKDERRGRTGFAHLFEHLMFEGSAHAPEGAFDDLLESAGGVNNGATTPDHTTYWETVPSNALELALWLEADRMGWMLPAVTREKLDGQREVVKNERRQVYENRPYGLAFETILETIYPADHPYHSMPIGSLEDLEAATIEDVREFSRTYYVPNNASLVVAGAVDTERVRSLVEQYFGEIPRGPEAPPVTAPPVRLSAEERKILEDDVGLPRLYLAWPTPAFYAPGDAAMDVVAEILAGGRASRLYRRLVHDREIAQDVNAFQNSGELGSTFFLMVTARPDVPLSDLERVVRDELAAIAGAGVDARELERARNTIETGFVDGLERVGGFDGKADRLNRYAYYTGDPGYAAEDLARYHRLTPEAVRTVVRRHLVESPGVVLSVVPEGRQELAAKEDR